MLTRRRVRPCVTIMTFRSSRAMFSLAKSRNMVAMNDVALLYTSSPDSPCGNLSGVSDMGSGSRRRGLVEKRQNNLRPSCSEVFFRQVGLTVSQPLHREDSKCKNMKNLRALSSRRKIRRLPVVKSTKSGSLCFGFDDTGQILEIPELLFRQTWLFSNPHDVIGVKRFDHTGQSLFIGRKATVPPTFHRGSPS